MDQDSSASREVTYHRTSGGVKFFVFVLPVVAFGLGVLLGLARHVSEPLPSVAFAAIAIFSMDTASKRFEGDERSRHATDYLAVVWVLVSYLAAISAGATLVS